jgi:hypothetical protein
LVAVAAIGYFVVWPRSQHGSGHTVGSSSGSGGLWMASSPSAEAARQARLSRFEQKED